MTRKILVLLVAVTVALGPLNVSAADSPSPVTAELKEIISQVRAKLREGTPTEASLADQLKAFDALLAKHKDEKTDDVAQILYMKAMLYLQVFEDDKKGAELVQQLKTEFPETHQGKNADEILDGIKRQAEARKLQSSLVAGVKFPDFEEKDLEGGPLSIANYKGKVVLIDFWATWCGPCVAELPNVLKTYEKHHAQGFDIIGISLDQDQAKLKKFIADKQMPWKQYFDGKGWGSKLGAKYGVNSIPATYLLDGEGKIIAKNLRGEALETAVAKVVSAK
jgi:peroxiredoxin